MSILNSLSVLLLSAVSLLWIGSSANSQQLDLQAPAAAMTSAEKLKEHSKLYTKYKGERKLTEVAATTTDDVTIVQGVPLKIFQPGTQQASGESFISKLGCKSDAVVIGLNLVNQHRRAS